MRREVLLVAEIIDSAERIVALTSGVTVALLDEDRNRREALLWSFTVLGERRSNSTTIGSRGSRRCSGGRRLRCGTGSCTGTGRSARRSSWRRLRTTCLRSSRPFERSRRRSLSRRPNRRTTAPLPVGRRENEPTRLAWVQQQLVRLVESVRSSAGRPSSAGTVSIRCWRNVRSDRSCPRRSVPLQGAATERVLRNRGLHVLR